MKSFKKLLCLALSLLMLLGVASVTASANEDTQTIKGSFDMHIAFSTDKKSDTYYYNDNYFIESGTESNEHLRTMSAALAFTLYGKSDNAEEVYDKLPDEIGFENIAMYDMDNITSETMGVVFGTKTIGEDTVVMVALRSDEYDNEWASNLTCGKSGDASGFAAAADLIMARLNEYLRDNEVTSPKFWVTGYSRGGAVANLVGKALNENLADYGISQDEIYVYTFEAPRSSDSDVSYPNIHNIIDRRDLITYVYPEIWGMYNNGVAEYIGSEDDTIMSKQLDFFGENYMGDYKEVNTADFLKAFADFLGTSITRETYAEKVEPYASSLIDMYFKLGDSAKANLKDYFSKVLASAKADSDMFTVLLGVINPESGQDETDAAVAFLLKHVDAVAETEGKPVSDEDFEMIRSAVKPLINAFSPVIKADLAGVMSGGEDALPALYHIMSMAGNAADILKYHYNYNIYNQLKALDSNFDEQPTESTDETRTTEATEVTQASEVTQATETTEATEATQVTEATNPTEPADVTAPTEPAKAKPRLKASKVSLKAGNTSTITVLNKGTSKVSYKSSNTKVATVKNGKVTALKKGSAKVTVTVGATKLTYAVKVTTSPKLSKSSVTVKKNNTVTVKITGKASTVKNVYTNTKVAKVVSATSAASIKVKGLKKGSTTLRIKVNGVVLKLKVNVKAK